MDYSRPELMWLRRIGQQLGILRPMVRLWRKFSKYEYEDSFDKYIFTKIKMDSTVWDIGANVGFFTEKFSKAVGPKGKVFAFDPSPQCIDVLKSKFNNYDNVLIEPVGLSNSDGQVAFSLSSEADPTGGIGVRTGHDHVINVNVITGDTFLKKNPHSMPNYLKIDVEGFELDVLQGMSQLLQLKNLKSLFVEVHFLEMKKRGMIIGPKQIVQLLSEAGFQVYWIDPSHLAAERY
jgi:FkbM family methyltransferase